MSGCPDHDLRGKRTHFHISRGKQIKFTLHVKLNAFTFISKNKQLSYITFIAFYGTYNALHNMDATDLPQLTIPRSVCSIHLLFHAHGGIEHDT